MNPTDDVLEQRLAALAGGVSAVSAGSGHAEQVLAITTRAQAGDTIVSTPNLWCAGAARRSAPTSSPP